MHHPAAVLKTLDILEIIFIKIVYLCEEAVCFSTRKQIRNTNLVSQGKPLSTTRPTYRSSYILTLSPLNTCEVLLALKSCILPDSQYHWLKSLVWFSILSTSYAFSFVCIADCASSHSLGKQQSHIEHKQTSH